MLEGPQGEEDTRMTKPPSRIDGIMLAHENRRISDLESRLSAAEQERDELTKERVKWAAQKVIAEMKGEVTDEWRAELIQLREQLATATEALEKSLDWALAPEVECIIMEALDKIKGDKT